MALILLENFLQVIGIYSIVFVLSVPSAYIIGYMFGKGYHKAKRDHIQRMLDNATENAELETD